MAKTKKSLTELATEAEQNPGTVNEASTGAETVTENQTPEVDALIEEVNEANPPAPEVIDEMKALKGVQSEAVKEHPQYDNPNAPGYVPQAAGTVRYPMAEGIPFDFLPNDGTIVKGSVVFADGSKIIPGTYYTAEGLEIVVQSDGTADIIVPATNEQFEKAKELFKQYPEQKSVLFTSDNQAFFSKNSAELHAKSLTDDFINTINKADVSAR